MFIDIGAMISVKHGRSLLPDISFNNRHPTGFTGWNEYNSKRSTRLSSLSIVFFSYSYSFKLWGFEGGPTRFPEADFPLKIDSFARRGDCRKSLCGRRMGWGVEKRQ